MKKKPQFRIDIFDAAASLILLAAAAFIAALLLVIALGGALNLAATQRSPEALFAIRLSLYTATISTLICMALAIPCAYIVTNKNHILVRLARTILELPMSLPNIVVGLCLLMFFSSDFGFWLKEMGIRFVFDRKGIIMAQLMVNLPFAVQLVRTAMQEVDKRLEFMSGLLGASKWQSFVTITLPLCKNALLCAAIFVWSRALGEFGATLMLVGVTRMKTETLPASIYLNISTGDIPSAMSCATILLVFSCLSFAITNYISGKSKNRNRSDEAR